jgi:hypothetical protein
MQCPKEGGRCAATYSLSVVLRLNGHISEQKQAKPAILRCGHHEQRRKSEALESVQRGSCLDRWHVEDSEN